eukprot:CAMPEP_0171267690 /NCGR_PEP_ID=MMETSP0790-20130122/59286_1 /TAXON_ID=2925 /ORGANISM="Alexandrium catenella, Strain OF101" /LENGTH=61 /DNA_ID=CAMNT_0011736429 /DNA_START=130 /DNA_END=312 /DNA_ORIENTATION=+
MKRGGARTVPHMASGLLRAAGPARTSVALRAFLALRAAPGHVRHDRAERHGARNREGLDGG